MAPRFFGLSQPNQSIRSTKPTKQNRNTAAEELATHILEKHPDFKGLIFVEGTQLAKSSHAKLDKHNKWWGGVSPSL